jgi:type II secretory ATPase GspE/PulE/Tfp pilus assembly ATPase PilB-like protein
MADTKSIESKTNDSLQTKLGKIRRDAEERDAERRAKKNNLAYIDLRKTPVSIDALRLVPAVELKARDLALVVCNPQDDLAKKIVVDLEAKKYKVKIFVSSRSGIEQIWPFYRFAPGEAEDITGKVKIEKKRLSELMERLTTFQAVQREIKNFDFQKLATASLLEVVLAGALSNKASDIHFEAEEKKARIRFRLDGLLHDVQSDLPLKNYESLVTRVKLLSGMKINVRGEAQDGRFTIALQSKEVEVRVSVIPSEFGETIVTRLLDPDAINVDLGGLGLRDDDLVIVKKQLANPNGLILNTGPTGSGKTTTLYAFLKQIVRPEIKIITIEDPIEYRVEGIEQTQVNPEAGYTFAKGLRAIVRQDPDVVLVGEIRDLETADIALQAALTGHLVFSTLHTNDAVGAVPRLINLGVKSVSIGPALTLIIAQRLVRRLCDNCKKSKEIPTDLKQKIEKFIKDLPERVNKAPFGLPKIFEPSGCNICNNFGYKGRVGIFEFLESKPEFEETILKDASEISLRKIADSEGMVTMQEDGVLKALSGITTFSEVEDVTGTIEW